MTIAWREWGLALLDLIFPGECPICEEGAYMDEGYFACKACLDKLAWINGSRCRVCGAGMPLPKNIVLTCSKCRELPFCFTQGRSMFYLDDLGRALIHSIKYHGNKRVMHDASHWLSRVDGLRDFLNGSVLVPVPLHRKKLSQRGFNQSVWIADAFCKLLDKSTVVYDCLDRTRKTPSQTNLSGKERKENVKNAFALKEGTCLDGFSKFVIMDDVFTTGSTLDACARVLLDAGCSEVRVFTLGHG